MKYQFDYYEKILRCCQCPILKVEANDYTVYRECSITGTSVTNNSKPDDCPLKEVRDDD